MAHRGSIPNPVENLTGAMHLALGDVPDYQAVFKFGFNDNVGSSFTPVCINSIYRTPQVSGATQLRIKAGNAADNPAGIGARKLLLRGIDAEGNFLNEFLETNGSSAGTVSVGSFLRLYSASVTESGTYATTTTLSHVGEIVIENAAGTEDWAVIRLNGFARGQTEIGAYTTPITHAAAITDVVVTGTSNQPVDVIFMIRTNVMRTDAPYTALRALAEFSGLTAPLIPSLELPPAPISPSSDIIWFAKTQTSASVSVQFNLLLKRVI